MGSRDDSISGTNGRNSADVPLSNKQTNEVYKMWSWSSHVSKY